MTVNGSVPWPAAPLTIRFGALLRSPTAQSNPDLAGSLDDLLGAVYALIQAKQHGFSDRSGRIDITAVEKHALSIARGKVRTDGKWIAGFYFNNALFRTAAVFHRSLKIVTGRTTARTIRAKSSFTP